MCVLLSAAVFAALSPSPADLERASTKVPRNAYKGVDQTAMSSVLNGHLLRSERYTVACEDWTLQELQEFMAKIEGHRSPELQEVYEGSHDRRRMTAAGGLDAHWRRLNMLIEANPHLTAPQRDAHCREAVMWWTHHLAEAARSELRARNVTIPLLPLGEKKACGDGSGGDAEKEVCLQVEQANSCQQCHVGGSPSLFVPEVKPTTPRQMARRCYTNYKALFNITCGPCDGVVGKYWGDDDDKDFAPDPCEVVGHPEQIPESERVLAAFPAQFSVDLIAGSDRWGRTTNPAGHVKTPFPPWLDSMYGAKITGKWFANVMPDSDLWLLRHDTHYGEVHFNGTAIPSFLHFDVSEIHSQTRAQQAVNNSGPMVSLIKGLPDFAPGGCTCVADPVGVPDTIHSRTPGIIPEDSEMRFLGRINLTLAEADGSTVTVDHWANWFFHVFMDVDKSVPYYGKAPRRIASAYAGTATYGNWKLEDPAIADPTVWKRGIPTSPMKVGPDHGKFCMNPTKIPMCENISQTTFPPKPAAPLRQESLPWHLVHKAMMPTISAEHVERLASAAIKARRS